jgi:hypothetical protein
MLGDSAMTSMFAGVAAAGTLRDPTESGEFGV